MHYFGKLYEALHQWLDEFAGTEKYGMRHRRVRHHKAGIREAVLRFGDEASAVAAIIEKRALVYNFPDQEILLVLVRF